MKNKIFKYGLFAIIWIVFTLPVLADPGDPPIEDEPDPVPIDNWILLLIFAGVALGTYFIKQNKKISSAR